MKATGGALVYETLKSHGVSCIFGMEDPVHLFHAVDRSFTRIVTVRDEKHAAIMAHGYAQATGRPGVCASTFGPGATNLITGLLEAQRSSVPVIALVQDHSLTLKDKHASSALDHATALALYTKTVIRIDAAEQAGDAIRKAFRIATTGRPGPVAVLCPNDVMAADAEAETWADQHYTHFPANRVRASRHSIEEAARLLVSAERPLLIAGGGCVISNAQDEVRMLAELLDIPVATTMTGRGAIEDAHPLAAGPLGSTTGGRYGRGQISNALFSEADVAFIMGSRTGQICYSNWTLPKPGTKVIHLDIDPEEIGRNFTTDVAMVGDVRDTLRDLLMLCADQGLARTNPVGRQRIERLREEWHDEFQPVARSSQSPIRPERLLSEISAQADKATLVVTDASYITGWAMSHIDVPQPGRFILSPRGTGGIGWSLPAAIGAKIGDPSRKVVCLTGDGAFGYVFNELETAARYAVDVLVVVFNNGTLGFQRHWEQKLMGTYLECDFLDIDYSEVARALKCRGERVTDAEEIEAAIARGLSTGGPYVIDVVIDPNATAPIVGFEEILERDAVH
ncbi:thiamine pyrophosphate-binding protein [Microvirga pudoricolor]|uniref:thiamine pyrophosphate-binding protein n=1 Tax=Microvirga pudoricolor TaxID=2778729 RepID=UPI0019507AB4|nr:thiamine pyrophosphate-binding protein [Microvirga pudoricolor]MBM6595288.1 thiamine pyrophosphate-binding protein [Microvirga pudoricolor]